MFGPCYDSCVTLCRSTRYRPPAWRRAFAPSLGAQWQPPSWSTVDITCMNSWSKCCGCWQQSIRCPFCTRGGRALSRWQMEHIIENAPRFTSPRDAAVNDSPSQQSRAHVSKRSHRSSGSRRLRKRAHLSLYFTPCAGRWRFGETVGRRNFKCKSNRCVFVFYIASN